MFDLIGLIRDLMAAPVLNKISNPTNHRVLDADSGSHGRANLDPDIDPNQRLTGVCSSSHGSQGNGHLLQSTFRFCPVRPKSVGVVNGGEVAGRVGRQHNTGVRETSGRREKKGASGEKQKSICSRS